MKLILKIEKMCPKGDIQLCHHCRILPRKITQFSPQRDHWGNLESSTTGDHIDKQDGAYSNWQTAFLHAAKQKSQLCPSAKLSWWPCLARSSTGSCAWFGGNQQVILAVECVLWMWVGKETNPQPHPTAEHNLSPTQPGSLAKEPQASYSPMQAGNQANSPAQLLSIAPGPTQSGSPNSDPG